MKSIGSFYYSAYTINFPLKTTLEYEDRNIFSTIKCHTKKQQHIILKLKYIDPFV